MASKIVERIAAEAGIPRLATVLSENLPLSDLQSLLLDVYKSRTAALDETDVWRKADRSALVPSTVSARLFNEFDRIAFQTAADFEAVELSPLCPLGLNHVLGSIDQNNVLTAIRNVEVLADPTTAMALECARRRKNSAQSEEPVRLCNSHRALRLQPLKYPGYVPHFRLFSMVSAGRDTGSNAFEIRHLREHLQFYLTLFRNLRGAGFSLTNPWWRYPT